MMQTSIDIEALNQQIYIDSAFMEVLNAETSLKEAQSNYYNALYDAIIAKIDLDQSLGNFKY